MIELEHVAKSFRGNVAVEDLTLSIPQGAIFSFLGPNGAGKTTTIRILTGLLKPDRGEARVCGRRVTVDDVEVKRQIGYIPDQPYLYEKLTGREFLEFVGSMYGMDRQGMLREIDALSERFDVRSYLDDLAEGYSHGMRQRIVFCAALLHRPRALVVDEPMVGLDPRSIRFVKDILRERSREGTTVFMSTHTLSSAQEISDKIGVIHRGRLVACGTVEEIRALEPEAKGDLEETFLRLTAR